MMLPLSRNMKGTCISSLSGLKVRCLVFSRKAECFCPVLLRFHFTGYQVKLATSEVTKQAVAMVYFYYARFLTKRTRIVDLDISLP